MISGSVLSTLVDQFTVQLTSASSGPLSMKFDRYVYWLETKLLSVSQAELSEFNSVLDMLVERLAILKSVSSQCRSSMIVYNNSAQVNRVYKLYDSVDALGEPYLPGRLFVSLGSCPISSLLPDLDIINDMVLQGRLRLKAIDEMATSKKNDVVKFKGSKTATSNRSETKKAVEISSLRTEIRNVSDLIEKLAVVSAKNTAVLGYFSQIKQAVHYPLHALSLRIRSLPPISESTAHVDHELEVLHKVDAAYNAVRRAPVLVSAAVASREAAYIEDAAEGALAGLRHLGNEEVYQVLVHLAGIEAGTAVAAEAAGEVPEWLYNLRRMAALPTASILHFCTSRKEKELFAADIASLRAVLEGASGSSMLATVHGEVVQELREVDAELLCAFAADWSERMVTYDTVQKSGEFAHAYEQLCGARNAYDRARHKYERSARLLEDARAMHREATAQLGQLKDQFIEIALSEVGEVVEFVS